MEMKESGEVATNIVRFFTLLLISAGFLIGVGSELLLKNGIAEALIVGIISFVAVITFVWVTTHPSAFVKLMSICVFIASVIIGLSTVLLVGKDGAIGITAILFAVVLVWGLWAFREE
jgi:hypothetical protein